MEAHTARPEQSQDGASALGVDDGLVHLRRQSDWTGRPRKPEESARSAYRAALDVATATLAAYDGGTAEHSDDVVTLCMAIAEELEIKGRERAYLLAAAELHDIGKVAVPPTILSKPSALDPGEWDVVRRHTITGERILSSVPELVEVARVVRHCHERWDGDGYPDGLAGEQIPLASRVVFCADAYHAIRGDRPYRRGRSARAALAEVEAHSGTQFDPDVVDALVTVAERARGGRRITGGLITGGRRSQRLAALLLTMAIGGSAFAAVSIWEPGGGEASPKSDLDPPAAPARPGKPAKAVSAPSAAPRSRRASAAAARRAARAATPVGGVRGLTSEQGGTAGPVGEGVEAMGERPSAPAPVTRKQPGSRRQSGRQAPAGGQGPAGRQDPPAEPAPAPRTPVAPAPVVPLPTYDGDEGKGNGRGQGNGNQGRRVGHERGRGRGHDKHGDG